MRATHVWKSIRWGLFLGILSVWLSGCYENDTTSSPHTPPPENRYDLKIELVWEDAINMDVWIIEPTGKGSGHGEPGDTAQNTGNNDCGFGDMCSLAMCSDLPCNTPENICIPYGMALPETTEPFHHYEVGISNWSSTTTTMILTIMTSSETRRYHCTVDGPRVSYVAQVTFPAGRIDDLPGFVGIYCM